MYTREELEKRVFVSNKEEWIEAAAKDYRSKEDAKVQVVERGFILPMRAVASAGPCAGGVYDENLDFVACFRRDLENTSNWKEIEKDHEVAGGGAILS